MKQSQMILLSADLREVHARLSAVYRSPNATVAEQERSPRKGEDAGESPAGSSK